MSFFELPPRKPDERETPVEPPSQPWWGPPGNELGAPVPLRLVLARVDELAVAIIGATAYTTGVELRLAVRRLPKASSDLDDDEMDAYFRGDPFEPPFGHPHRRMRQGGELAPEILRFGIQFSDGRKATTVGEGFPWLYRGGDDDEREPPGPLLMQHGGSGGNGNWEFQFWLWPLPPDGPLAFVVEWPAEGIELKTHEVDSAVFRDAAAESDVLWPDAGGTYRTGGGTYGVDSIVIPERRSTEDESPAPKAPASDQ